MTRSISSALKAHYALGTTTIAQCWKATLRDGTVITATTHTEDLVIDAITYVSTAAYNPSDIENDSDLTPDNLEVDGFLRAPGITIKDIHGGRWDYAQIELFEVNFADLTQGIHIIRKGTLGRVKAGRSIFNAELRGLTQAYSRKIVTLTTKECLADFGDARCKINKVDWRVFGTVDSETDLKVIFSAARTEPADWFTGGLITFTSGANNGLSMEVKSYSPGVITLTEGMPFNITAADTDPLIFKLPVPVIPDSFMLDVGCQKRFYEDCIGKFSNPINFRGFPHLPGVGVYGSFWTNMTPPGVVLVSPPPSPTPAPSPSPTPPPPPAPGPSPAPSPSPPPSPAPAPTPAPSFADWGPSPFQGISLIQPIGNPADLLQEGDYWIMDGEWGAGPLVRGTYTGINGSQYQTAYGRGTADGSGRIAWRSAWAWPIGTTEVKAYPASIYGNKPGYFSDWVNPGGSNILLENGSYSAVFPSGRTPNSIMPIPANGFLSSITASGQFAHAVTPSGLGHLSFDIWLQSSPNQNAGVASAPLSHEIMIPLHYWGNYGRHDNGGPNQGRNFAIYQHDTVINGMLFHLYMERNFAGGWTFVVFEPDNSLVPISPFSLKISDFLNYLVTVGWATGNEFLVDIELGVEPVEGVGDLVVSNYKVTRP